MRAVDEMKAGKRIRLQVRRSWSGNKKLPLKTAERRLKVAKHGKSIVLLLLIILDDVPMEREEKTRLPKEKERCELGGITPASQIG